MSPRKKPAKPDDGLAMDHIQFGEDPAPRIAVPTADVPDPVEDPAVEHPSHDEPDADTVTESEQEDPE